MSEPLRSIGDLAQLACAWEVLARKAGNVCPGREFPDLTVDDFLNSAKAIAPVLDRAPMHPLGVTILRCIEATRQVVNTNTNLGIVLLLAPLASVPLDEPLKPGLARVLNQTTIDDSRNVYAAIRLARPGGLGKVKDQDVTEEPTLALRDVMALAKERDLIAAQYTTNFAITVDVIQVGLARLVKERGNLEQAIIEMHLCLLHRYGDDLIRRKLGENTGISPAAVNQIANGLNTAAGRKAFLAFDEFLRSDGHARNPGTTADMIAAGLFVALRESQIAPNTPFAWPDHPFAVGA